MSRVSKKSPYLFVHPSTVVKTVQKQANVVPVQQFKVLFPVWDVQIVGNQRESQDYGLLERFIERGIGQGGLHSAQELTKFFRIPEKMLGKMLTYLRSVNHLEDGPDNALRLTQLGQDSLRDQVFYRSLETHRTLYFEGYNSHPLLREHYDLTFLTAAESDSIRSKEQFFRLYLDRQGFNERQISWLREQPDRATKYNLPDEIDISISSDKTVNLVYLPISIVEVRQYAPGNKRAQVHFTTRYLVLSHIYGWHDVFFEGIVNKEPTIANYLKELAERPVNIEEKLEPWVRQQGIDGAYLEQTEHGIWQVVIDADAFHESKPRVRLKDVGNFKLEHGYFLQIWCHEKDIRRKAALEQTLISVERQINSQQRVFKAEVMQMLERNAVALQIEACHWMHFETYVAKQDREEVLEEIND